MGKRQKTDKLRVPLRQRLTNFRESCLMVGRGLARILYLGTWIGLVSGSVYGLYWCHDRALSIPEYRKSASIKLTGLPPWLSLPRNRHVLAEVIAAAKVDPDKDRIADDRLTSKVARNLQECPWIQKVKSVRKLDRGNVLLVDCEYRMPAAWVQLEDRCYLVDTQGYRLPGVYDPYEAEQAGLVTILGAQAAPPEAGEAWNGGDIQAALQLAELLQNSLRGKIAAVDVANYGGRDDPRRADIKLQPRQLSSEIYWGHAPDEEFDMELPALDKIRLLEDNLKRYGRIDGNRPYLDIRTTPPYQPVDRMGDTAPKVGAVARQPGRSASQA